MKVNGEEVNDEAVERFKKALKMHTGVRNGGARKVDSGKHKGCSSEHKRDGESDIGDESIPGDGGKDAGFPRRVDKQDVES